MSVNRYGPESANGHASHKPVSAATGAVWRRRRQTFEVLPPFPDEERSLFIHRSLAVNGSSGEKQPRPAVSDSARDVHADRAGGNAQGLSLLLEMASPTTEYRPTTQRAAAHAATKPEVRRQRAQWAYLVNGPWPLMCVLAVQAVMSLRLVWSNTTFQDEALYLWAGRMEWGRLAHGIPIPAFPTYFSGAPVIYPPLGAVANSIGGLAGARLLSLCFMLGTTALLWSTASRLFGNRAGFFAAALFAVLGPTLKLGAFATFDAMSLFLIALAAWCVVRAGWRRDATRWMLAATCALVLGNVTTYSSALFDPVVVALAFLVAIPLPGGKLAKARAVEMLTYGAALLVGLIKIAGGWYARGIRQTVLSRAAGGDPPWLVLHEAWTWTCLIVVLSVIGILIAVGMPHERRRVTMLAVLSGAALLAPIEQARIHTETSLDKHAAMGAWFAAIAAGYAVSRLAELPKRRVLNAATTAICAAALIVPAAVGFAQARALFAKWPNATSFIAAFQPLADRTTGPMLVETPSLGEFYIPAGNHWQRWSSTYDIMRPDGVGYGAGVGQVLKPAVYSRLIAQGWFKLIALNGAARSLDPHIEGDLVRNLAYREVADPVYGTRHYRIWERVR
jgi:hypothetical protein